MNNQDEQEKKRQEQLKYEAACKRLDERRETEKNRHKIALALLEQCQGLSLAETERTFELALGKAKSYLSISFDIKDLK